MTFTLDVVNVNWSGPSSPDAAIYTLLANAGSFTIQVENGFFNANQICTDIENRMNSNCFIIYFACLISVLLPY